MLIRGELYSFIFVTLLLGAVGLYISTVPQTQMEQGRWVTHTHEVLNRLSILSEKISEAHAEQRAYLKIGQSQAEQNYQALMGDIEETTDRIAELTKDNPAQQARIAPLREAISSGLAPSSASYNIKKLEVQQHISDMQDEETRLLKLRESHWEEAMVQTRLVFFGGMALVYAMLLWGYYMRSKETRVREQLLKLESENTAAQRGIAESMANIVAVQQDIIYQRLNLQNAMEVITHRMQEISHGDGAVIEMLEGDEMVYRAASGTIAPYVGMRLKAKGSMSGLCVESATALRCEDSENDPRVDKEACRKVGLRSMVVVPLIYQGDPVGVLKVSSRRAGAFTLNDVNALQLMAGVVSVTLRDAASTEALQNSNKSLDLNNQMLQRQKTQLESDKQELTKRADTDGLTGLKNHRYFKESLNQEFSRAVRHHNPLSLIMCDVDHFKSYNDEYGHPAGDAVLQQLAQILKKNARPSDCVARYGGEEFALILMQTPLDGARTVAHRLCEEIRRVTWPYRPITLSVGIAAVEEGTISAQGLIAEADKALYLSKKHGRDRITVANQQAISEFESL